MPVVVEVVVGTTTHEDIDLGVVGAGQLMSGGRGGTGGAGREGHPFVVVERHHLRRPPSIDVVHLYETRPIAGGSRGNDADVRRVGKRHRSGRGVADLDLTACQETRAGDVHGDPAGI